MSNKKNQTYESLQTVKHTHNLACVHSSPGGEEEAKGRLLPVPLGHLLTFPLDFSKFGLHCELCDAFHIDAFKEHGSLEGKQKAELGLELKTPAPTHTINAVDFQTDSLLFLSHCVER